MLALCATSHSKMGSSVTWQVWERGDKGMARNSLTHTFSRLTGLTREMFERRIVHVERNMVGYG